MRFLTGFLVAGLLFSAAAQQPPKKAPSGGGRGQPVSSEAAFKVLNALNEQSKLVVTFMGATQYTDLKAENCFGWRFPDGPRILGESGGEYYGLSMETVGAKGTEGKKYDAIGALYAEAPFLLQGKLFKKGAYMVYAAPDELRLDLSIKEDVRSTTLALKEKLDKSLFGKKKGEPAPRFSFVQVAGQVYLVIGSNRFRLSLAG